MPDPTAPAAIDTTDLQQPRLAPCALDKPVIHNAGRIKSDWWSMRADLKPMSSYDQPQTPQD